MKRAVSILLAALLLLIALPTYAEEGLQAGLYISDSGSDVLYLDEKGVGVLNFISNDQYASNGVLWTGTSLEIERTATPFTISGGTLFFTYGDAVRVLRYEGAGEAYALGDQEGMAFAGTYVAEGGRKLTLIADGSGVYADAAGEKTIFWGSLTPYWKSKDKVCFVLFDSWLSGLVFTDGALVLSTETEGDITFQPEQAAVAEALQTGLYISDEGKDMMYLNEEGVGMLTCPINGQPYMNGVVWNETSLEIERTDIPFTFEAGRLSFAYAGEARTLRYQGALDRFTLGDRAGTAFAGEYASDDGRTLSLAADGRGVYRTADGEKPVFWGSLLCYFEGYEGVTASNCYLLFDSYFTTLTFGDDGAVLTLEEEGDVTFRLQKQSAEPAAAKEASAATVVSSAFDLALTLPAGEWTVEETEAGLLITRAGETIQYTFLSLPLEKAPNAATLDLYADHIWTDCLRNLGVAYDGGNAVRSDFVLGTIAGRQLATGWTRDKGSLKGDSILWYANGRLYAALCVSDESARDQALALLEAALATFRTAAEAQVPANELPVDRAAFESIRDLAPVPDATEEVYYGYRMTADGQTLDLIPLLTSLGMDPKSFCLVLRSDGTGSIQLADEASELTWTEDTFTDEEGSLPYTREGDHILLTMEDESIEFVPAAEMEALLAKTSTGEPVAPADGELLGSWTFTKAKAMGMEFPASVMGTDMGLVLNEDGSAILLTDGSPTQLSWAQKEDGTISLTAGGSEIFQLTYDGTVLILSTPAEMVEMIFEKDA